MEKESGSMEKYEDSSEIDLSITEKFKELWKSKSGISNSEVRDHLMRSRQNLDDITQFGVFNAKGYAAQIIGLVRERFSGAIVIKHDAVVRKLFFREGELIFAASNQIDERLGEIVYQSGFITIEQLTEAAVQVDRNTKFGKVLIVNGILSCSQLWDMLCLQVIGIFKSTFLVNEFYLEVIENFSATPTSITLSKSTLDLIDDCLGYAAMFGDFKARLRGDQALSFVADAIHSIHQNEGTFLSDLHKIIDTHLTVHGFLGFSKFSQLIGTRVLCDLYHAGAIDIHGLYEGQFETKISRDLRDIRILLDGYHHCMEVSKRAFEEDSITFPISELRAFLGQELRLSNCPLLIQSDGIIASASIAGMFVRGKVSARQVIETKRVLSGLISFLLQITGDLLPGDKGWKMKQSLQDTLNG